MIILYIGIGFLALVLGLIAGSVMTDNKIFIGIKDYFNKKKAEKEEYAIIKQTARKQALQELQPELVKHIKQQELDKLTTTKKDKLKKFADMFEMKNDNFADKLGSSNQGSQNNNIMQNMGTMNNSDKSSNDKSYESKVNDFFAVNNKTNFDANKFTELKQDNNKDMSQFIGTQNTEDKQKEKERLLNFLR